MSDTLHLATLDRDLARPFHALQEHPALKLSYAPNMKGSEMLHANEVHAALIPSVELSNSEHFLGLPFGIALSGESNRLMLYAHQEPAKIHTVYIFSESVASARLLRLTLKDKFRIAPRFVRTERRYTPDDIGDGEAVLMFHETNDEYKNFSCYFQENMCKAWTDWTKLPFVLCLWATPEKFKSSKHFPALCEALRECIRVHGDYEPHQDIIYAFDGKTIEALNLLIEKSATVGLSPHIEFQLKGNVITSPHSFSPQELLDKCLEGNRLSMKQGLFLAEHCEFEDLILAADMLRRRLYSNRVAQTVQVCFEGALRKQLDGNTLSPFAERILLIPAPQSNGMEELEHLIGDLKSTTGAEIEGVGVPRILDLANESKLHVRDVIGRLAAAGLDGIPSWGGSLLTSPDSSELDPLLPTDWIKCMQWAHRLGLYSSCSLEMGMNLSWRERIYHLARLRSLQDLSFGFRSFHLIDRQEECSEGRTEERLKVIALARLFLDNVPAIFEVNLRADDIAATLGLWCGANGVQLGAMNAHDAKVNETRTVLLNLWDKGMSIPSQERGKVFTIRDDGWAH